ncbi:MAG: T9SS type A sorting domain-containing protein, partial [Chitinivibrionales bacterium]|nr:T9SS type A sorting domain-containing protein [Chitinivibrionales bacterium]MBD3397317.1 T9SS type A sorting domain-containing protein [Chitinivibrionales bacterium]
TLEPGAVSNPLVVRGARVDAGTVTLTVNNATLLPTDELLAYVDSIGIWYESTDWPAGPDWSAPDKFKYSLASIVNDSVFDVNVPELDPGGDSTYFFAISPYWRNVPGDSLPPFDQANGDEVMMFDTVPVANNLVINDVSYNRTDTTISLSISGADDIDSKAESLYVWYGITNDPFSTAGPTPVPVADVSGDPYSPPPIKDASLAGDTQTIYVAVALMGGNGILSAAVVDSVEVGTPRPSNTQTLDASKIGSYGAALEWSDANSVRIWYGTSLVPTDADPTPATHAAYYPSSSATKDTLLSLNSATTYYFGLQVWSGGRWSLVTDSASAAITTDSASTDVSITNTVSFDTAYFDTSVNMLMVAYSIDTAGMTGKDVQVGICYSTEETPVNDTCIRSGIDIGGARDTVRIDIGEPVQNTTYYVSIWVRVLGEAWVAPTDSSVGTFMVQRIAWAEVSYFEPGDTLVEAFGGEVKLKPGPRWGSNTGAITDILDTYTPDLSEDSGLVLIGTGFQFRQGLASPELYIGISFDSLPDGIDTTDLTLYRDSAGVITVIHRAYLEDGAAWVLTNNLSQPFLLMADTLAPVVTVDSIVETIITESEPAITKFVLSDNVSNPLWRVVFGKGNEAYVDEDGDTIKGGADSISLSIPSKYSNPSFGLRALIIVSDGVNTDTINVSRQVKNSAIDDFRTEEDMWIPLRVTAVPDDTSLTGPLERVASDGDGNWTYDKKKFRLFRWYPEEDNDTSAWLEYSSKKEGLFSFVPGRVLWIKTDKDKAVQFGDGVTTSLRKPYEIRLPSKNWTDISIPFKFAVMLGDIIEATGPVGDSLYYYHWDKDSVYIAGEMYIEGVPSLADRRYTDSLKYQPKNDAYTVYNPMDSTVTLRIPPTPPALSSVTAPPAAKRAAAGRGWDVWLSWKSGGGPAGRIRCGAVQGSDGGPRCPVPPRFGKVFAGVVNGRGLYGHAIAGAPDERGGYSYEIRFYNQGTSDGRVVYRLENLKSVPPGMRAALFDPVSADTQSIEQWQSATLGAGNIEYRWVVVGSDAYLKDFVKNFRPFKLALNGIYPNPSRGRVAIRFTVPFAGLRELSFSIYDLHGRTIWEKAIKGASRPGENTIVWNGRTASGAPIASGVYMLRMNALEKGSSKRQVFKTRMTHLR